MANPLVIGGLAIGALWLMFKKPTEKKQPATTQQSSAGGTVLNIPASVLNPTGSDETVPDVKITVPTGSSVTPQQVVTSVLPQLVQQAAQAVQASQNTAVPVTTTTTSIPVGVAKFPDVPVDATPQQVATAVLPQLVQQAVKAADTLQQSVKQTDLQHEEVKLDQDPYGTVLLAKAMISSEASPGWKKALAQEITAWQLQKHLTADGKFGPKSALAMADEVGVLPLIRYFPATSASKASALKAYRDALYTKAANVEQSNPALAAALRLSATYDEGQGWATTPAAVPAANRAAQVTALAAELKRAS